MAELQECSHLRKDTVSKQEILQMKGGLSSATNTAWALVECTWNSHAVKQWKIWQTCSQSLYISSCGHTFLLGIQPCSSGLGIAMYIFLMLYHINCYIISNLKRLKPFDTGSEWKPPVQWKYYLGEIVQKCLDHSHHSSGKTPHAWYRSGTASCIQLYSQNLHYLEYVLQREYSRQNKLVKNSVGAKCNLIKNGC